MKAVIHCNGADHQKLHASAMRDGLARHGVDSTIVPRGTQLAADFAVLWGFKPPDLTAFYREKKIPMLIMERGYLPDRMIWASLGWDGLNYRARFPRFDDGGARYRRHWPELMQPWKSGGEYVLVIGQVPGDASLYGLDMARWACSTVQQIASVFGPAVPIVFRPHPLMHRQSSLPCPPGAQLSDRSLADDLAGASLCVTFNSNTGVEAVMAGVPTVTMDGGAMAWPVASHAIEDEVITPDRTAWAHQLAWCQWELHEIADGTAWEHLKNA